MKKEGAEEEKEQEKLGKLEYSLDYNFTEAQVRQHFNNHTSTGMSTVQQTPLSPEADRGDPPGSGPGCYGHGRDLGPLRQSLSVARQKEKVRDQSTAQESLSRFQRDVHLQGTTDLG